MGAGASLDHRGQHAYTDGPVLSSLEEVDAAHLEDKQRFAGKRKKDRERLFYRAAASQTHVRYQQPLVRDKLDRTLFFLDDIRTSFGDDQRRRKGHTEVAKGLLTTGGAVRTMCVCDASTVVCASVGGPLWVYDWREGAVISRMRVRTAGARGPVRGGGHTEGVVTRLCLASEDAGVLASGDEHGFIALWDLSGPSLACEARVHEGAVTGLRHDTESGLLLSTSEDTYIMVFDIKAQTVTDRAKPKSCTCGDGVASTALGMAGESRSKLLLVGGLDGKLRVWAKDDGPMRRLHTLPCGFAKPTQCLMAPDGWTAVLGTAPADPVLCGAEPARGGLIAFDLRRLGGDGASAFVAEYRSQGEGGLPKAPTGTIDVALAEEDGHTLALCITDGVIRTFNLGRMTGSLLHPVVGPEPELVPQYDFDVVARHDDSYHPLPYPCAIATVGRFVIAPTTAPSMGVWHRRPGAGLSNDWGRGFEPPMEPLELVARCVPRRLPGETPSEVLDGWEEAPHDLRAVVANRGIAQHSPAQAYFAGEALAKVEASLQRDRWMAGLVEEYSKELEDKFRPERPEAPTPRTSMAGGRYWSDAQE